MTQEEIIRMAKECGVHEYGPLTRNWSFELSQFERFAALVAAHEREALAEQEKQEPVAIVTTRFSDNYLAWDKAIPPAGTKLYAAPVDAKAIRAEALEEAAKVCDNWDFQVQGLAKAIRNMK